MKDRAALIIVTHNNWTKLERCLTSIYKNTEYPYHIFLIDNNSTDDTDSIDSSKYPDMTVVKNYENRWWSGGINQGIDLSRDYKYIFFLNDDIILGKGWLVKHLVALINPTIAVVGCHNSHIRDSQCYDNIKDYDYGKKYLPIIGDDIDRNDLDTMDRLLYEHNVKNFPDTPYLIVTGMIAFFCVGFRRDTIDELGYLDENLIMYENKKTYR